MSGVSEKFVPALAVGDATFHIARDLEGTHFRPCIEARWLVASLLAIKLAGHAKKSAA
jgi:hypothetical protein